VVKRIIFVVLFKSVSEIQWSFLEKLSREVLREESRKDEVFAKYYESCLGYFPFASSNNGEFIFSSSTVKKTGMSGCFLET